MNTTSQENAKNVFVVYGRNELAKRAMYEFLINAYTHIPQF